MKKIIKKFKKINTSLYINNFYPNYINKWVFRVAFIVIFFLFIKIAYIEDFDFTPHAFIECKSEFNCPNTFYQCQNQSQIFQNFNIIDCEPYNKANCEDNICSKEFLEPNEILGKKPSEEFKEFPFLVFLLLILAFLINHLLYLRRSKNDVKNNFKE